MSSTDAHDNPAGPRYCFMCGHALYEGLLSTEERARLYCPACGYVHYINPKVVCGTLPQQDGMVWLLRRGIEPRRGYWTYPAGFQEIDESAEEGALRETIEELGCPVFIQRLLGLYSRPHAPVNVVYLAEIVPALGTPRLTLEAIEVRAFLPRDIPWSELAFQSTRDVLEDWVGLVKPRTG
jgi:ADP-ribose pyrophosphatase YjhB (NUDIX family)